MTPRQQDAAIAFCFASIKKNGVTGRLRIAQEGYVNTYVDACIIVHDACMSA
jgi:hypothetical protein